VTSSITKSSSPGISHFGSAPASAVPASRKRLDPDGNSEQTVIECTDQPRSMINSAEGLVAGEDALFESACLTA
jgi:hypothetical protein